MSCNNVLGLIFANTNEQNLPQLTAYRTTGSIPFGGKFRMIDFTLSNMSNSGINNVGIIIKDNFQSLMDHLGNGAAWDLAHRRSGIKILPPYTRFSFDSVIESINSLHGYIDETNEEYVLITPSDIIQNIDYNKVYTQAVDTNADITLVFSNMNECKINSEFRFVIEVDNDKKVTAIKKCKVLENQANIATGAVLIKKSVLKTIVKESIENSRFNTVKDILQHNFDKYTIYGYEAKGYCKFISSFVDYYEANMDLFDSKIRNELFNPSRPIYTKIRDDSPSKYGLNSSVKGSLIAQGCVIEGTVENSIVSKGVYIGKNTTVKNCIIMQDTIINENCELSYIVIDKDVVINKNKNLNGSDTYPMYIAKRAIV